VVRASSTLLPPSNAPNLDVEHLAFVYFSNVSRGLNPKSQEGIDHVHPYYQLATDLANQTSAQYNFITPNLGHDGHEGISPCATLLSLEATRCAAIHGSNNTSRSSRNRQSTKAGGALFVIWDEAEDSGAYGDGPIGMFLLSPFAKGGGKKAYSNSIYYTHSSTLKTVEEIFGVTSLLGVAGDAAIFDLSDFFSSPNFEHAQNPANIRNSPHVKVVVLSEAVR